MRHKTKAILLKYLITALALYWLYKEVIGPLIAYQTKENKPNIKPKQPKNKSKQRFDDEDGEYIDYEELN